MVGLIVLVRTPCVYPRGWREVAQRVLLACIRVSPPHPPPLLSEIKVIGGPDELAEQILAPSRARTHVSTCHCRAGWS